MKYQVSFRVKTWYLLWLHNKLRLSQGKNRFIEMVWYFIGVYIINRTLHGRLEIRNFSSRVENISRLSAANEWNIFQHSRRNFVSPRGHVISSMFVMTKLEKKNNKKQWDSSTKCREQLPLVEASLVVKRSLVAACLKFLAGWNATDLWSIMVVFSSVSALKFLKENLVGAFKRAKHAQRRTIGIKIWLYTHPRNFGCDKLVRPSLPPYVYLMQSKKEILFKVCIKRLYKSLLSIEITNFMYCFNVDIGNIVVA